MDAGDQKPQFSEHSAAILATEHWSLLSSRSLGYNEAFNRVTVFLTVLSASIVALALVVNAQGFGGLFVWAAVLLGLLVLFLGITTFVRLVQINLQDALGIIAMNRLRHAYIEMAPELVPYFSTGWHDDEQGVLDSILVGRSNLPRPGSHFLVTTPTVIAVVVSFVGAGEMGLILNHFTDSAVFAVVMAGATLLALLTLFMRSQLKSLANFRAVEPRFPSPRDSSN